MPEVKHTERMVPFTFRCFPSLMKKLDRLVVIDHFKSRSDAIYIIIKDYVTKREEEIKQKQAG